MPRFSMQPGEYLYGMTRSEAIRYVECLGLSKEEHAHMMKLAERKPDSHQITNQDGTAKRGKRLKVLMDYAITHGRFTAKQISEDLNWNYFMTVYAIKEAREKNLLVRKTVNNNGRRNWEYSPAESRSANNDRRYDV